MGKYRQGRKIFWATLALLLLVVAMPFSVAGVEYWNEHIAGTESVAYNFDNSTAIDSYFITGATSAKVAAAIYDPEGLHAAALSPFWGVQHNNESGWNEVIVDTGASTTDNTSAGNSLFFSMNVSAKNILNKNINKLKIAIDGLNANTTAILYIKIAKVTDFYGGDTAYSLKNGLGGYVYIDRINTTSNGTLRYTLKIDPAIASLIASKQDNTTWVTKIVLLSADPTHDIISEGNTVYFKIQYLHPHGRAVVGTYDATEVILAIWTGIGIAVLFVTSPAWNPTTHNGLIEHIIQHRRYSRAHSSRSRSRRTHRTHRSSHRRRTNSRRRRR